MQYAGRLHRLHPGKTDVRIFDYADTKVPMLGKMFDKRLRGYRSIGYTRIDDTAKSDESGCTTVEYDHDELAALDVHADLESGTS